jgi:hypothetical protein
MYEGICKIPTDYTSRKFKKYIVGKVYPMVCHKGTEGRRGIVLFFL